MFAYRMDFNNNSLGILNNKFSKPVVNSTEKFNK